MLDKTADGAAAAASGAGALLKLGREQTAASLKVQQDVLAAFEEANRAWLARVQSEVDLWSQLAAKLSATHSVPDALRAYQELVAQRMQMAADDGKRLSTNCQQIFGKLTQALSHGWPSGRS